jgi:outer membrane biosynthesis protein TonB
MKIELHIPQLGDVASSFEKLADAISTMSGPTFGDVVDSEPAEKPKPAKPKAKAKAKKPSTVEEIRSAKAKPKAKPKAEPAEEKPEAKPEAEQEDARALARAAATKLVKTGDLGITKLGASLKKVGAESVSSCPEEKLAELLGLIEKNLAA